MTNRRSFRLLFSIAATLFSVSVGAQTPATVDWQNFGAPGEEFSVVMPKDPTVETGKMPYHKMELNTRLYLSNPANGPVYAIASFSGIKSNPELYSEGQRLNSYVDAFKKFFIPRIKGKDAVGKMTLARAITLNGHEGREYKLSVAELSGSARVFVTRKRFYAIAFLSKPDENKTDDALRERFISSFTLPEKAVAPPQTASVKQAEASQAETATVEEKAKANSNATAGAEGEATASGAGEGKQPGAASAKPDEAQPATGEKKPISGGVLNGKALSLPKPIIPSDAKGVTGAVTVQITIDEYGNVISATATSGPASLQQSAVTAAYSARFSPTTLMGEPVKVTGVIVYQFK